MSPCHVELRFHPPYMRDCLHGKPLHAADRKLMSESHCPSKAKSQPWDFSQGLLRCSHSPSQIPELNAAEQPAFHRSVHTFHIETQTLKFKRTPEQRGSGVNLVTRQFQVPKLFIIIWGKRIESLTLPCNGRKANQQVKIKHCRKDIFIFQIVGQNEQ